MRKLAFFSLHIDFRRRAIDVFGRRVFCGVYRRYSLRRKIAESMIVCVGHFSEIIELIVYSRELIVENECRFSMLQAKL